jgi:hypothetical protein
MILTTSQLVETTLGFYDNMNDEAANSYILSFILLRVGCVSKTYDFEQFLDMNREEKDQIIKEVRYRIEFSLLNFSGYLELVWKKSFNEFSIKR